MNRRERKEGHRGVWSTTSARRRKEYAEGVECTGRAGEAQRETHVVVARGVERRHKGDDRRASRRHIAQRLARVGEAVAVGLVVHDEQLDVLVDVARDEAAPLRRFVRTVNVVVVMVVDRCGGVLFIRDAALEAVLIEVCAAEDGVPPILRRVRRHDEVVRLPDPQPPLDLAIAHRHQRVTDWRRRRRVEEVSAVDAVPVGAVALAREHRAIRVDDDVLVPWREERVVLLQHNNEVVLMGRHSEAKCGGGVGLLPAEVDNFVRRRRELRRELLAVQPRRRHARRSA